MQWRITNKKKGKKWGTEQVASYKRNDRVSLNKKISEMQAAEEKTTANNPVDLDKLKPYTSSPKVCFFCTSIVFACMRVRERGSSHGRG